LKLGSTPTKAAREFGNHNDEERIEISWNRVTGVGYPYPIRYLPKNVVSKLRQCDALSISKPKMHFLLSISYYLAFIM
jgi:hypothetical protein